MKKLSWHNKQIEDIYLILNSDSSGLSQAEVNKRLSEHGQNKLPVKKPPGIFKIALNQFLNPLIYVLLIACIISFLIGDIKDSFFIFLVIFINAAIGAFQEWKAEKSAESLQNLLKVFIKVKRERKEFLINSEELVPGDIVLLESGNKVPADIRLIDSNNLMADESLLTGESVAVEKKAEAITEEELLLAERTNMLFAGSVVTSGRAVGIVVETGLNTEVGKIAQAISILDTSKLPLIHRMEKFAKHISYIVLIFCILIAVIELSRGKTFIEVFFMITALAVSAIPEGLPAAVTVALSVGMSRMTKRNVIIRKLTAVEGLGSCTCIASDKTGTLTVNKQTVRLISLANDGDFEVTGESYTPEGKILSKEGAELKVGSNKTFDEFIKTSVICNEAALCESAEGWTCSGDAVDIAILAMANKYGFNHSQIIKNIETITEIPYESDIAYSARFYKESNNIKIAIKGAFEVISPLCDKMVKNSNIVEIEKESLARQANILAEQGYRIISVASGFAKGEKTHYTHNDISSLTFLGFICLIDPLRVESAQAVEKCKDAGVKVIMITGDHPATAFAIGKQLGIAESKEEVITGSEVEALNNDELKGILSLKTIFARVSPIQKLEIVEALIKNGNYVAVTGDGVNDAPALKKAHIGVAMGSGTDIAKDVSAMIITDDNFSSIVSGIEQGRYIYDNIRKVIYLLVSTGAAEIVLFLLSLLAGLPIPLLAVQLLWLNLVTNGIQGAALAFEKGESASMKRSPRSPEEGIFNKLMMQETILSGLTMSIIAFICWVLLLKTGWNEYQARNIVLLLMVLFENIQVFNCRSEYISAFKISFKNNVFLIAGVFIAQLIHILSMQIPVMQNTLKIQPVEPVTWAFLLVLAVLLLLVMEIFKKSSYKNVLKT